MQHHNGLIHKQRGVIIVFTALALVLMVAMAGLAIDFSLVYTNKTRLQNLADALALSAATSLLNNETSITTTDPEEFAQQYAITNTLPAFINSEGNNDIKTITSTDLVFKFSKTLSQNETDWKNYDSIDNSQFVRVDIENQNFTTWLMPVLSVIVPGNFDEITVASSAVAGFTPIAPCDLSPIMMCAEVDSDGNVLDNNCTDNSNSHLGNDCYGYEINALYCMKERGNAASADPAICPDPTDSVGPGNFSFLDFSTLTPSPPNPALKTCTAGDPTCSTSCTFPTDSDGTPLVWTKTGENFGQVEKGFNSRFGSSDLTSTTYPSDTVIGSDSIGNLNDVQQIGTETKVTNIYTRYREMQSTPDYLSVNPDLGENSPHPIEPGRRILGVPMVDCRPELSNQGKSQLRIVGYGCFFMAREYGNVSQYSYNDISANKKYLYGSFIGNDASDPACKAAGKNLSTYNTGYYKVILYQDRRDGQIS